MSTHGFVCKKRRDIGIDGHIRRRMAQRKAIIDDLTSMVYNIMNVQLCVMKIIIVIHIGGKQQESNQRDQNDQSKNGEALIK